MFLSNVWMWELDCEEGWAQTNWCFWTVVLEKTLESPLDCKEIQLVHSEGDQPWDHLMRRVDSLEETLMLGGIGGRRRRGWQRMRWLDGITESLGEFQELVMDRDTWRAAVHGVTKSWTGLTGWTELMLSPTLVFSDSLGLGGDLRVCISNKISDGIARDSLSVTSCKHWHVPTSQSQRLHQEWGHYGMMQNLTLLLLQRLHRTKIFAFAGLAVSRIYGCGVHGYKKKGICQRRKPM